MKSAAVRWVVVMIALSVLLNYVDRGAIGIAAPLMKEELNLSATQFGLAVSAFFWIYAPIQLIVGWACDRFCAYRVFALGLLLWALSTMLTYFVGGLMMLVALRVVLGIGESIAFPGSSKIIAAEVPASQRGLANAMIAAAIAFGPAVGSLAGGLILQHYGWREIFLLFGLATLIWLAPWHYVSRPFRGDRTSVPTSRLPMKQLLRIPTLWWSGLAHICSNYAFYFLLAWLPLYLVNVRHMSIGEMTATTTILFAVQGVSALAFGWLSDRMVQRGAHEGQLRRWLMVGAHVVIGISILAAGFAASNDALVLSLFPAALALGIVSTNIYAVAQIFAGSRASGSWVGVQNALGNASGIFGPIVTGILIDRTGNYVLAFSLAAAVGGLGALIWIGALRNVAALDLDGLANERLKTES